MERADIMQELIRKKGQEQFQESIEGQVIEKDSSFDVFDYISHHNNSSIILQ